MQSSVMNKNRGANVQDVCWIKVDNDFNEMNEYGFLDLLECCPATNLEWSVSHLKQCQRNSCLECPELGKKASRSCFDRDDLVVLLAERGGRQAAWRV